MVERWGKIAISRLSLRKWNHQSGIAQSFFAGRQCSMLWLNLTILDLVGKRRSVWTAKKNLSTWKLEEVASVWNTEKDSGLSHKIGLYRSRKSIVDGRVFLLYCDCSRYKNKRKGSSKRSCNSGSWQGLSKCLCLACSKSSLMQGFSGLNRQTFQGLAPNSKGFYWILFPWFWGFQLFIRS